MIPAKLDFDLVQEQTMSSPKNDQIEAVKPLIQAAGTLLLARMGDVGTLRTLIDVFWAVSFRDRF